MARHFSLKIKNDPARYALSVEDAERIEQAVIEFRDALAKSKHRFSRSMQMTMQKDEARAKAEKIVRKYGNLIRLNENIPAADKITVGIRERSKPVRRKQECLDDGAVPSVHPLDRRRPELRADARSYVSRRHRRGQSSQGGWSGAIGIVCRAGFP